MNTPQTSTNSLSEQLILSENAINYLKTTAKWVKFLCILSFISFGFLLVGAIFTIITSIFIGNNSTFPFPFALIGIFYLVLIGIMIVPTIYLFKFATKAQKIVILRDAHETEEAFRYLMSYYRFMGIFTIVIFGFYLLALIVGVLLGGFGSLFYMFLK